MPGLLRSFALFFLSLGGFGLLLLGILDSSFLFLPLGNDLLVIILTAGHHQRMLYYAAMATAGSVLGTGITDWVSRKGGQKGLNGSRRTNYVKQRVERHGAIAIAAAALLPPPFPFTLFIIAASALQYPRKKLFAVVAGCRAIRFAAEGSLALIYGRQIIRLARSPGFQDFIIALVVISIAGTAWSIWGWARKARG